MSCRRKLGITLIALLACSGLAAAQGTRSRNSGAKDGKIIQKFQQRVNEYVEQRKKDAGTLPEQTDSATELKERREEVRARIQNHRANAKAGDVFTPDVASYFRKQIKAAFKGRPGSRVATSLRRANPIKELPLKVNQPYPDGMARQSMPASLLLKLPKLPRELEYRIVGNNLALIDIEPNLVVDILPDVIPAG